MHELKEIRSGRKLALYISQVTSTIKGILFFIHGVGGSCWIWHKQIEYFNKRGYKTVAFDLLGHGRSPVIIQTGWNCSTNQAIYSDTNSLETIFMCPRSKQLSHLCHFEEHEKDVEAIFINYVCPDRNAVIDNNSVVVVIAHSYGTSLAVQLVSKHENKIDRLVLISGGAPTPLKSEISFFSLPSAVLACFSSCILQRYQKLAFAKQDDKSDTLQMHNVNSIHPSVGDKSANPQFNPDQEKTSNMSRLERQMCFKLNAYILRATMTGQIWSSGDAKLYSSLRLPVLLISGSQDKLVTQKEEEETLFNLQCGQLKRLYKAGHMGMLEDAVHVNYFIEDFIKNPPKKMFFYSQKNRSLNIPAITQQPVNLTTEITIEDICKKNEVLPDYFLKITDYSNDDEKQTNIDLSKF